MRNSESSPYFHLDQHQGNRFLTGLSPFGAQNVFFDKSFQLYETIIQNDISSSTYKPQNSLKGRPVSYMFWRFFFLSKLDTMVPHSWLFYFLTKRRYGFINKGADSISYKIGFRFGADPPPHFIGPVRRGIKVDFQKTVFAGRFYFFHKACLFDELAMF